MAFGDDDPPSATRSQRSQSVDSAADLYNITKPSNYYVRGAQYVCICFAIGGFLYFAIVGRLEVFLQYIQIAFITSLTVTLDSKSPRKQKGWLALTAALGATWIIFPLAYSYDPEVSSASTVAFSVVIGAMYITGIIMLAARALEAPADVRFVELDTMTYLLSLNALCLFSQNTFNNNLHMVLDLRTIMLLYTCIYRPKTKMELLRAWGFVTVMSLIVLSFIFYSSNIEAMLKLGDSMYIIIGAVLMYDSRTAKPFAHMEKQRELQHAFVLSGLHDKSSRCSDMNDTLESTESPAGL